MMTTHTVSKIDSSQNTKYNLNTMLAAPGSLLIAYHQCSNSTSQFTFVTQ